MTAHRPATHCFLRPRSTPPPTGAQADGEYGYGGYGYGGYGGYGCYGGYGYGDYGGYGYGYGYGDCVAPESSELNATLTNSGGVANCTVS